MIVRQLDSAATQCKHPLPSHTRCSIEEGPKSSDLWKFQWRECKLECEEVFYREKLTPSVNTALETLPRIVALPIHTFQKRGRSDHHHQQQYKKSSNHFADYSIVDQSVELEKVQLLNSFQDGRLTLWGKTGEDLVHFVS